MIIPGQPHTVTPDNGRTVELGVVRMRLLAGGQDGTNRAFTLAEFAGSQGAWTIAHKHLAMEESFFVLDGQFTFIVGEQQVIAESGTYLLVPRGTSHDIVAGEGGGRLLTLMVPGGLEDMFFELGQLPPDSITDAAVRAAISSRYDSVPV